MVISTIGDVLKVLKRYDEAILALEMVIQLDQDNIKARESLETV